MEVQMMTATVEKPLAETRLRMPFVDWTRGHFPPRPDYELQFSSRYVHSIPTAIAWAGPLGAYVETNGLCLMTRLSGIATSFFSAS